MNPVRNSLVGLLLVFVGSARSQEPVGLLETNTGNGMATVVWIGEAYKGGFIGKAVTARHVIDDATTIKLRYSDGQVSKNCKVLVIDQDNDVAVVSVWVPKGLIPMPLAKQQIEKGRSISLIGREHRTFQGISSPSTNENKIFCDLELLSGDSGGPVMNERGQLVGVISGGWFWYGTPPVTWPARSCNLNPIRKLLSDK